MFKLFKSKRSKKQVMKDIHFLCLEISDILEDMSEDLDDLHESVQESNKLVLLIQDQCNEIISKMEKNNDRKDERTLEQIVDNIENIISNMENKNNGEEDKDVQDR